MAKEPTKKGGSSRTQDEQFEYDAGDKLRRGLD